MNNILLLGGGLDSIAYLILMYHSKNPSYFSSLWINYGQFSAQGEFNACKYFCNKYSIELNICNNDQIKKYNLDCNSMLFSGSIMDNPYVKGRNLSFIMQALEYGTNIYLGFSDPGYKPFPDADINFISNLNDILCKTFSNDVHILAPFISSPRLSLLEDAYKLDKELFSHSFTCWTGIDSLNMRECGICKHCSLKEEQFKIIKSKVF